MARAASEGSSTVSQIRFDSSGICEDGEAIMVVNAKGSCCRGWKVLEDDPFYRYILGQ
jgi:hypothetical protein